MNLKIYLNILIWTIVISNTNAQQLSQINYFETWTEPNGGIIKSTDPAGITWDSNTNSLYIADSEINEYTSINNTDKNIFNVSLDGTTLINSISSLNSEPTGITFDPTLNIFFITNDDTKKIYKYNQAGFSLLQSEATNSSDPEGITCDPQNQRLYVIDGTGRVLIYNYNLNFLDDFIVAATDPEGIAFHPELNTLFIVDGSQNKIFEYTTQGQFIRDYDISGFSPTPIAAQGLTFGSRSDGNSGYSLFIADGMIDNNEFGGEDSSRNGQIFEAVIVNYPAPSCNDYSISLDGSNDYVKVNYNQNLFPSQITLASWINPSSTDANDYIISTKQQGGYSLGVNITTGGSNQPNKLSARCQVNGVYYNIYGTSDIPTDSWSHVALTYDGTKFKIYVNGIEENDLDIIGILTASPNSDLFIGAESNGTSPTGGYFDGLIDDVAIFNTPLTSIEIQQLMNDELDNAHVQWNNLEGYWSMNEGTGSITNDISGNNNTATLGNEADWNCDNPDDDPDPSCNDYSISLDGSNDYVKVNYNQNLFPSQITLASWINPSSTDANDYIISTKQQGGYSLGVNITTGGSNQPNKLSARCQVNGVYYNIYGTSDIPTDSWSHVALTYDGTKFKIYVNGIEENDLDIIGILTASPNSDLFIGAESNGTSPTGGYFDGLIDDVAIFNTPLTSIEIQQLMNDELDNAHVQWNNLEGYWSMNEGTGSITNDISGNNNTATLGNEADWNCDLSSNSLRKSLNQNINAPILSDRNFEYNYYPNPFNELIFFEFQPTYKENITIIINDMYGKTVKVLTHHNNRDSNKIYWDGKDSQNTILKNGIYIFTIVSDSKTSDFGRIIIDKH